MIESYFELGGVSIPAEAHHGLSQDYEILRAVSRVRMSDGTLKQQQAWGGKLKTTIQGKGWLPAALDGIDYSQPLLLKCGQGQAISSASNAIALPSARRSDAFHAPTGYAIVSGKHVSTGLSVLADTATLDVVSGATQYGVVYYPEITVYADPPETSGDLVTGDYSWSLTAEEI